MNNDSMNMRIGPSGSCLCCHAPLYSGKNYCNEKCEEKSKNQFVDLKVDTAVTYNLVVGDSGQYYNKETDTRDAAIICGIQLGGDLNLVCWDCNGVEYRVTSARQIWFTPVGLPPLPR